MAHMLHIGKNVRFAVVEFGVTLALVFISYKLVFMQGGLEAVGIWSSLVAWTSLIRIGDAGMANATLRFVATASGDDLATRRYLETGLVTNAALFGVLSIFGYFGVSLLLPTVVGGANLPVASAVLPLMLAGFFLSNLSGVSLGALQGLHLGYVRSQIAMAGTLIQLVGALLLVPQLHLVGLATAQALQHAFTLAASWLILRRRTGVQAWLPVHVDAQTFREMLGYSVSSQVANLGNGLFEPMAKILVNAFGGLQVLGLFELAYKTVALARNIIAAAVSAALPALSTLVTHDPPAAVLLYRRSVQLTIVATLVVLLGLVVGAPVISYVWLGQIDNIYWLYVILIGVGFTLNTIGAPAYNLGTATGNQRGNIAVSWLSVAILCVVGSGASLLTQTFGVVIATALSLGVNGILIRRLNEPLIL